MQIRDAPEKYETSLTDVEKLEQVILQIEGEILCGRVFMNTIHSFFASPQDAKDLQGNSRMLEVLQEGARTAHLQAMGRLNGVAERAYDREMILGALGLQCIVCWLGGDNFSPDKKLMRSLWETHRKYGNRF